MNIRINFKNRVFNKSSENLILFVNENFDISAIKKYISKQEYDYVNDLLKTSDLKKNLSLASAVTKMRPPTFWAEKNNFLSQAKIWEKEKINKVLEATYNLEISAKSNSLIDNSILLKKLLVDICNEANVV